LITEGFERSYQTMPGDVRVEMARRDRRRELADRRDGRCMDAVPAASAGVEGSG
jgi:hypothetical protein